MSRKTDKQKLAAGALATQKAAADAKAVAAEAADTITLHGERHGKILSFIEYRGTRNDSEISSEVESLNLQRRDLNESQRAMLAAKMTNVGHGGDRKSDQAVAIRLDAVTQAKAAERARVSE